jgi:DNA-binding transcriptional LysR family regulator
MKRIPPNHPSRAAPGDRIGLLRTFVDIVEAGSLSAAADRSDTTQPTVSRRLCSLEEGLGVRLLDRTTHSVRATPDGERCLVRARELLREWDFFEEDLRGASVEPEGVLRVVVPHAFGQERLVGPLAVFLRRFPKVRVEWMLRDALPDFVSEGVDCALHLGEVRDPNLVTVKLVDVPRIAVASPSLLGSGPVPVHPRDLERFPWLSFRGYYRDGIELRHETSGRKHLLSFPVCMGTDNIYALRAAAVAGLGVCVGSAWLFAKARERGELVHLLPGWQAAPLPLHLVYPYSRRLPARLRRFAELMRELAPEALAQGPSAVPGGSKAP